MSVFGQTTVTSASVKTRIEAVAIAEALIDETLSQPYATLTSFSRPQILGVSGTPVSGYIHYSAQVDVVPAEAGYLSDAKHITVTVSALDPEDLTRTRAMSTVVLEGYRSNHLDGWL